MNGRYDKKIENKWSRMNTVIRSIAIGGYTDCTGPIEISWKTIDEFVFVIIMEYTGKWWYRVFRSSKEFHYERDRILDPSESADDLIYVYGYYENVGEAGFERELQMLRPGDWAGKAEAIARKELYE